METAEKQAPQHSNTTGYGPHPGNCPACVAKWEEEKAYCLTLVNPHRPGTKVHARWERENRTPRWSMDLRSEAYWSM